MPLISSAEINWSKEWDSFLWSWSEINIPVQHEYRCLNNWDWLWRDKEKLPLRTVLLGTTPEQPCSRPYPKSKGACCYCRHEHILSPLRRLISRKIYACINRRITAVQETCVVPWERKKVHIRRFFYIKNFTVVIRFTSYIKNGWQIRVENRES